MPKTRSTTARAIIVLRRLCPTPVPNLKVILVTGVGLFIALERIDLLGADAQRYLNAVSMQVLRMILILILIFDLVLVPVLEELETHI